MPLSEQEQRLLDEMERSLYQHDADFVATAGGRRTRPNYRMLVIGILVGIVGIVGIVLGVATRLPVVGIIGFVVLFGGALLALSRSKDSVAGGSGSGSGKRSGFLDRMNERWDRRQEEQGR